MEFVNGTDLADLVRRWGPLPFPTAAEVVRQAAVGLQYIHENGRVHRDLKPSNLILSATGEVKILDLGLSLLPGGSEAELTGSSQAMGTADYMAPEQWLDSHGVDIRADIYSLGCTLFKLLTGFAPFAGSAAGPDKRAAHLEGLPPSIRSMRPDVPEGLAEVLARSLCKNPDERFATPGELAQSLRPYGAGADLPGLRSGSAPAQPVAVIDPVRTATPPTGSTRRRFVRGVLAAAVLAAGGIGAAVFLANRREGIGSGSPSAPASTPFPPRDFRLREWSQLLDRPPTEYLWVDPAGLSHWTFNDKAQTLNVLSFQLALLGFGRSAGPAYKLQVGFRQTRWTGNFGVFFGARPRNESNPEPTTYQAIRLEQRGVSLREFNLVYSQDRLVPRQGQRPLREGKDLSTSPVTRALGSEEVLLELVVTRRDGLASVRWAGEDHPKLLANNPGLPPGYDFAGEFGVVCVADSVFVSSARFLLLP
jgi:hypothetical protein